MPVKRKTSKRRVAPEAQLEAWRTVFETGHDFFGEASALTGLCEPVRADPLNRPEAQRLWLAAARDAWERLGPLYCPADGDSVFAWAERTFGRPWEDTTHAS